MPSIFPSGCSRTRAVGFLMLVCCTLLIHSASASSQAGEPTTTYYGVLEYPRSFQNSEKFQDPLYANQPGEVVLTDGQAIYRARVNQDGSFTVKNLPFGSYLLQADFYDFVFPTIRVDVQYRSGTKDEKQLEAVIHTYRNEYPTVPVRGSGTSEETPAMIPTAGLAQYYVPREVISLYGLIKNPMVILMAISGAIMIFMKFVPEEDLKQARADSRNLKRNMLNPQSLLDGSAMAKKKQ